MSYYTEIKFGKNKPTEIFSMIAQNAAREIKSNRNKNKSTQIRKFYDELAMWNERVSIAENQEMKFNELVPFIKMLKAKVAYAKGRDHVDDRFYTIFNHCIDQIQSAETLRDAKLFMEAVIGYCKLEENQF